MSDFIVEKLTKSVGDKTVFKEISFIIEAVNIRNLFFIFKKI